MALKTTVGKDGSNVVVVVDDIRHSRVLRLRIRTTRVGEEATRRDDYNDPKSFIQ
jgi:hypothetical protein